MIRIFSKYLKNILIGFYLKIKRLHIYYFYKYLVIGRFFGCQEIRKIIFFDLAFNNIHFLTRSHFYKISYKSPNTLDCEVNNYEMVSYYYKDIAVFLPFYKIFKHDGKIILRLKKLNPIVCIDENVIASKKIIKVFDELSIMGKVSLDSLPFIKEGLRIYEDIMSNFDYRYLFNRVSSFLQKSEILLGPVHNDLHPKNIMIDQSGNIKIIDLDCLSTLGIRAIDHLYYQIESNSQIHKNSWIDELTCFVNNNDISFDVNWRYSKNILAILLLLNRVGIEYGKYKIIYSQNELNKIKKMYD